MNLKKWLQISTVVFPMTVHASALTLYTTSWSMYGENPYEYDGAYKNGQPYGKLSYVKNPQMVAQFNQADVVAWSFLQVWNDNDPYQSQYNIPKQWTGLMHFDDLWGELPFEASWVSPLPPETPDFLNFCKANEGACSSVQMNGNTGVKELFNYTDQKGVGQLNSFGAFIQSNQYTAKRIIAIGGANTVENHGISTATFDAIFSNQNKFLAQFKSWMNHFKNLKGVDYDFEPPIDLQTGAQIEPNEKTLEDYRKLFELAKATRQTLGKDAYISITITVNKDYLSAIHQSVPKGWFKEISPYVNALNLMTYDLHGPWSHASDPWTAIHAYLKHPTTAHQDDFTINYGTDSVTETVLKFGMPKEKLQVGIAAYGRGFSGVEAGPNHQLPGFEQPWSGSSVFKSAYTKQDGLLPYKSVPAIIQALGYQSFDVMEKDETGEEVVTGSYLYHPEAKQFVGYQSPNAIFSLCNFIKSKQILGSILWSADTDLPVSDPKSLVATYRAACGGV